MLILKKQLRRRRKITCLRIAKSPPLRETCEQICVKKKNFTETMNLQYRYEETFWLSNADFDRKLAHFQDVKYG